jgi:hypothetical protein
MSGAVFDQACNGRSNLAAIASLAFFVGVGIGIGVDLFNSLFDPDPDTDSDS